MMLQTYKYEYWVLRMRMQRMFADGTGTHTSIPSSPWNWHTQKIQFVINTFCCMTSWRQTIYIFVWHSVHNTKWHSNDIISQHTANSSPSYHRLESKERKNTIINKRLDKRLKIEGIKTKPENHFYCYWQMSKHTLIQSTGIPDADRTVGSICVVRFGFVCFFVLFFSLHFIEFQHYFWRRPWNIHFHEFFFCSLRFAVPVVVLFFTFPMRKKSEEHYPTWAEVDKCVQRKQWENEIGTTNKAMQADVRYWKTYHNRTIFSETKSKSV